MHISGSLRFFNVGISLLRHSLLPPSSSLLCAQDFLRRRFCQSGKRREKQGVYRTIRWGGDEDTIISENAPSGGGETTGAKCKQGLTTSHFPPNAEESVDINLFTTPHLLPVLFHDLPAPYLEGCGDEPGVWRPLVRRQHQLGRHLEAGQAVLQAVLGHGLLDLLGRRSVGHGGVGAGQLLEVLLVRDHHSDLD